MTKEIGQNGLNAVTCPNFCETGISHGFFTRLGGQSKGIYEGLNCGSGSNDSQLIVSENRMLVSEAISGRRDANLVTAYQIHGNNAEIIDSPWQDSPAKADALVTTTAGLVIGVLTADCSPVLFHDPVNKVIGAAHAGWKGAKAGILSATIDAMIKAGGQREHINVAVGPLLQQQSYEVTGEFHQAFLSDNANNNRYFIEGKDDDHLQFDMQSFVYDQLKKAGIHKIWLSNQDTYTDSAHFYSFRRTTHCGEPDYGRQISAIMLHGGT